MLDMHCTDCLDNQADDCVARLAQIYTQHVVYDLWEIKVQILTETHDVG